ncbi:MAG: hypothetical protein HZB47_15165 [Nitrosomonadales bacterium]|nr:hypothetical protein [Nitrosomonadales bacterium]
MTFNAKAVIANTPTGYRTIIFIAVLILRFPGRIRTLPSKCFACATIQKQALFAQADKNVSNNLVKDKLNERKEGG